MQTLRCRYTKAGNARYTAHLELAAVFFRAARRAALPVAYSQGFNPKAKMAFGPPLQLGIESDWEYVDIALTETVSPSEFAERFNAELPAGIRLLDVVPLIGKSDSIQATTVRLEFEAVYTADPDATGGLVALSGWEEKQVVRKRKRKTKALPLAEFVRGVAISENGLRFSICYDERGTGLKPFEALEAITGSPAGDFRVRKVGVAFRDERAATHH